MPEFQLPNELNQSGGIERIFIYINSQVEGFTFMLLVFIFLIILGAGYFNTKRTTNRGDLPMWMTIASFITTTMALILYLIPGWISLEMIIIMISVTLISGFFFLFSGIDN